MRSKKLRNIKILSLLGMVFMTNPAGAVDVNFNGFFSVVYGTVLGGEEGDYLQNESGYDCPCFIGDYANAGVYDGSQWQLSPDSRAGIQMDVSINDDWRFSTQVVGHGGNEMKPELSAMFFAWQVTENLKANIGRQRLPLFYYSDFYDVGYAYPWIRVPTDLYGWPISSYNGASLEYSDGLGEGTYRVRVFAGEEEDNNDLMYQKIYYASNDFRTHWKNMTGVSATYIHDWFDIRAVYMTNKIYAVADYGAAGGGKYIVYDNINQEFAGVSFNVDYNNLLIRSEANTFHLPKVDFKSWAKMLSIGYRFGDITPMLTYSRYDDFDPDFGTSEYRTRSATIRWDFMKNTAFKLQYDKVRDGMEWVGYKNFMGNTRAMSVGVDYVF